MPKTEKIYPEYIRLDGGTQPRAKIDEQKCAEYGERMKAGDRFPAVDVYFDGEEYWLADGFHRHQAQVTALPGEPIECNVYQGTLQDAQWHSYGVNKTHGLPRSNLDKKRAVRLALQHPNADGRSNYEIAEHCGVSEAMVRTHRNKATAHGAQSEDPSTTHETQSRPRTGRDGRTINTAKIGQTARRKSRRPRSAAEYTAARREGRRVWVPPSIVKLELPNNHVHNCAYGLLERFTFEYLQKVFQEIVHIHQQRVEQETSQ